MHQRHWIKVVEEQHARIERLKAIETSARTFLNEQTDQNAAALGDALAGEEGDEAKARALGEKEPSR